MANRLLSGVNACVFDAYGTLFDFASAARSCADVLGDAAPRLSALWRDKQLQYTWLRAAGGRHADFWRVTGDALDFTLETLGLGQPGLRERLMALYLALEDNQLRLKKRIDDIVQSGTWPEQLQLHTERQRLGMGKGLQRHHAFGMRRLHRMVSSLLLKAWASQGCELSPAAWIATVAGLCLAETICCPQARFLLEVSASQVILTIEAPAGGKVLAMLLPDGALIRR